MKPPIAALLLLCMFAFNQPVGDFAMRTLFDVLEECTNVTQVAVLKAVINTACIRAFYACLAKVKKQDQGSSEVLSVLKLFQAAEAQVDMPQVWKSIEAVARDAIMPKCQSPYDVPQSPAELFKFVLTSKPKPTPVEFLKALSGEVGLSVEDLIQFDQISQKMKQDELSLYAKDILQEYLGLIPEEEVEFESVPLKVWLILGEKALQAVEKEKQRITKRALMRQSISDLATIRLLNGDIPQLQQWVREVHSTSPYEASELSGGLELPETKTLRDLLEAYKK